MSTRDRVLTKANLDDAVYDETSGLYLVPHEDMYELSHVQEVYERLTRNTNKLAPTHRAIKFTPHEETTAHTLLADTTMWVSRIPFGYRPVGQKKSSHPAPICDLDYSRTTESLGTSDIVEGPGNPPVFTPIYARWPVTKDLPSNIQYEILYEIYTPSSPTVIDSSLAAALSPNCLTRGVRPDAGSNPAFSSPWQLRFRFYDNVLSAYRNASNIHVRYFDYDTYYTYNAYADVNGKVVVPENVPMSSWVIIDLFTRNFKVTEDNSSNYVFELVDIVDNLTELPYTTELGSPVTNIDYNYDFYHQVFLSARYYYKGSNDLLNNIDKLHLDTPLRIAAYADTTSLTHNGISGVGWFFPSANPPYIEVCQYNISASKIFGTVLHELGHASHYAEMGTQFGLTTSRIKESFASFMGWYNVKKYYHTVLTTDAMVHNACTQGRQGWQGLSSDYYTPIYIDLVDDFNQNTILGSSYVIDAISSVPVTDVLNFAIGPKTWSQSKSLMQQEVGVLYSLSDFNNLVNLY